MPKAVGWNVVCVAALVAAVSLLAMASGVVSPREAIAQDAPPGETPPGDSPKETPSGEGGGKEDAPGSGGQKPNPKPEGPPPIIDPGLFTDQAKLFKAVYGDQAVFGDMILRSLTAKRDSDNVDGLRLCRLLMRLHEAPHAVKLLKSKNEEVAAAAGLLLLHTADQKVTADVFARWKKAADDPVAQVHWNTAMKQAPCTPDVLAAMLKLAKAEEKKEKPGIAIGVARAMLGLESADCKELEAASKDAAFQKRLKVRMETEAPKKGATPGIPAFFPMLMEQPPQWTGSNFELKTGQMLATEFGNFTGRKENEGLEITYRILIEEDSDDLSIFSDHDDTRDKGSAMTVFISGHGRCTEKPNEPRKAPIKGKWISVRYAWTPKTLPDGTNKLWTFNGVGPKGEGSGYFLNVGNLPPKVVFRMEKGKAFISVGSVKTITNLP